VDDLISELQNRIENNIANNTRLIKSIHTRIKAQPKEHSPNHITDKIYINIQDKYYKRSLKAKGCQICGEENNEDVTITCGVL